VYLPLPFHPTAGRSSINDAVVVPGVGVYFTDAWGPRLLFVPPWPSRAMTFVAVGRFSMDTLPRSSNANGLLHLSGGFGARSGRCPWSKPMLPVGHFALAQLYAVRLPRNGTATRVDVRCGLPAPSAGGDACTMRGEADRRPAVMGSVYGKVRPPDDSRHVYLANPTRRSVTVVQLDERCGHRPGATRGGGGRGSARGNKLACMAGGWGVRARLRRPPRHAPDRDGCVGSGGASA